MGKKPSAPGETATPRRKLIAFDAETWNALAMLGKDSMKSIQELADEAIADLLKKHDRPTMLKDGLRMSARSLAANDTKAGARPSRKRK